MKKIILTVSIFTTAVVSSFAQNIDFGFENWSPVFGSSTIEDPQGWVSLNTLASFGGSQTVFKDTAGPAQGSYSAKITTIKVSGAQIPNPYVPGSNLDTAGLLAVGVLNLGSQSISYGTGFTGRPTVLSFRSKYSPMTGDSAFVLAYLTKWNGSSIDTIAHGTYSTGATTTAFALNSITLSYDPNFSNSTPDTLKIFISSSVYNHGGAKIGSSFNVDAFEWSGWDGVNELTGKSYHVTAYPNPATDMLSIKADFTEAVSAEITDITGRVVDTYSFLNNKADIQTSNYTPGIYMYHVYNQKKNLLSYGKFEVSK